MNCQTTTKPAPDHTAGLLGELEKFEFITSSLKRLPRVDANNFIKRHIRRIKKKHPNELLDHETLFLDFSKERDKTARNRKRQKRARNRRRQRRNKRRANSQETRAPEVG